MSNEKQIKIVEKIRDSYSHKEKEISKFEELRNLDRRVKQPAYIFAYIFGVLGTLILGVGMCFGLVVFEGIAHSLVIGIAIGVVGVIMVSINYTIFKSILNKRKAKYSDLIIEKTNELL